MIVKLPTEHYLEFLSLKGGCRGLSVSTLVKMSNCWKSSATAQIRFSGFVRCVLRALYHLSSPGSRDLVSRL